MRYLKLQIAFLFLLTIHAGWLVGSDNKGENTGGRRQTATYSVQDLPEGEYQSEIHRGNYEHAGIQDGYKNCDFKETEFRNCDFKACTNNNQMVLSWWDQTKMQLANILITNVGLPLGIQGLEKGYERYKQWKDPKEYAKKKSAEKEQEKAQKQLDHQMLINQSRLTGALVREKELAGQHTAMQLVQIQRKEVEGFVAGYEQKIKDAEKAYDNIVKRADLSEAQKKYVQQMVEQQATNYSEMLAKFNAAYDDLAELTIIASDMRTPGKVEAFGRKLQENKPEQKQPKNKKKKTDAKKQQQIPTGDSKHQPPSSPESPYDDIDKLLSTELKKIEAKLQQDDAEQEDDAEVTESSE